MATAREMVARESGGLVSEDVIKELFNITPVERPFIDSIGSTTAANYKKEFTDKILASASATNSLYENQSLSAVVNNAYGNRYYNLCQQMAKVVKLSERGSDVETTYNQDEYLVQIMDQGKALRMDEEAAAVSRNAATAEVANTSGALMAGAATWAIRNTSRGAGGANAVLDGTTGAGGGPTTAPVAGTARGFTEVLLRAAIKDGWEDGAEYNMLMTTSAMIENINGYLFSTSAKVAQMVTDVAQSNRRGVQAGGGKSPGGVTAQGAVNMFIGAFGAITLVPNRQMAMYLDGSTPEVEVVDILFIDTRYPMMAYLHNYDKKPIASTGLYKQEALYVDCTLIPGSTYSISSVSDINPATAMAAS